MQRYWATNFGILVAIPMEAILAKRLFDSVHDFLAAWKWTSVHK